MAFDKINDIDEEYSNKFIEQFEELPIEEVKNSNRLFVEKIKSMEKKVSILLYYIIQENNRKKNQAYQSQIVYEGEYDMADNRSPMKPIRLIHQQKIYIDEDFNKYQCQQCSIGFLKNIFWKSTIKTLTMRREEMTYLTKTLTSLKLRVK